MNEITEKFFNIFGVNTTTNFQLIKYAKLLKIPRFFYKMTDEINELPQKNFSAIINYHTSKQSGIHHVAIFNKNNKTFYFDSYGMEPQKEIIKLYSPLMTSNYQIQNFNTSMCGQLSLLVLYLLNNNYKFEDIILHLKDFMLSK